MSCLCDGFSSILSLAKSSANPAVYVVDDNFFGDNPWLNLKLELMLSYGSLLRPPDLKSTMVCTCFLTLLSKNVESGTVYVVVDITFWRNLASRYALSEGELRLERLQYGIDKGWLVMLLEHPAFTFKRHSLELFSKECYGDSLILIFHLCKFTRLSLFFKTSVGYSAISVAEILNQEETNSLLHPMERFFSKSCFFLACLYSAKFGYHDPAHMRSIDMKSHLVAAVDRLLIWFIIFLPRIKTEMSFFISWLVYNERYDSSRYVPRQGESHSLSGVGSLSRFSVGLFPRPAEGYQHFSSFSVLNRGKFWFAYAPEFFKDYIHGRFVDLYVKGADFSYNHMEPSWFAHAYDKMGFFDCQVLLQGHIREWSFIVHLLVLTSHRLQMLLQFPYGSSPRPPDDHISSDESPDLHGFNKNMGFYKYKLEYFHIEGEYYSTYIYNLVLVYFCWLLVDLDIRFSFLVLYINPSCISFTINDGFISNI